MLKRQIYTHLPLPEWKVLAAGLSFWSRKKPDDIPFPEVDAQLVSGWLSKSAWSFALIANWKRQQLGGNAPVVWVPDFFCDSSLAPMRASGATIQHYAINALLEPDLADLRKMFELKKPDILVYVHFFSREVRPVRTREFCQNHGIWFVEDAAHVIAPSAKVGREGDFVLFSPHKFFPVPCGATLAIRHKGPSRLTAEDQHIFGDSAFWPRQLGFYDHSKTGFWACKWLLKRVLQKLGYRAKVASLGPCKGKNATPLPPPSLGSMSCRFLVAALSQTARIKRQRRAAGLVLDFVVPRILGNIIHIGDRFPNVDCPYMRPFQPQDMESQYSEVNAQGWPVSRWPDLAENVGNNTKHKIANNLQQSIFYMPSHQSVNLKKVVRMVGDTFASDNTVNTRLSPISTYEEWIKLFGQDWSANLIQSWHYGEAKGSQSRWTVKRFKIEVNGALVAAVQVLQLRFFGLTLSRINRGPVFVRDCDDVTRRQCLLTIGRRFGKLLAGKVLFWAPNEPFTGPALTRTLATNFRMTGSPHWASSIVDLRLEEDDLLKNLSVKWRNMLRVAQRHDLRVEKMEDAASFSEFINNCRSMLEARGKPFPEQLYRTLKSAIDSTNLVNILLCVKREEQIIAGVWVVPHENAATYLLGWNGDYGRKANAHQLLIWEAMLEMKKAGISFFDLGGIDTEGTKGIASFKRGLGGHEYELVGEGFCF